LAPEVDLNNAKFVYRVCQYLYFWLILRLSVWNATYYKESMQSKKQTQETNVLLKMLALGNRQIEEGKVRLAADEVRRLRSRRR